MQAFPESGHVIIRGSGTKRLTAYLDCGQLGYGALAAHGHADGLQICLYLNGKAVLIDPGTYDYFTYPDWRSHLRGTRSHNTVCVDDRNQSDLLGPFMWGASADCRLVDTQDNNGVLIQATGELSNYCGIDDPGFRHLRRVEIDSRTNAANIIDELRGTKNHRIEINFHFAPEVRLTLLDTHTAIVNTPEGNLQLELDTTLTWGEQDDAMMTGQSTAYHVRTSGVCLSGLGTMKQFMTIRTSFVATDGREVE